MKRTSFSLRTLVSIQSSVLIGIVVAACGSNDQMPPVNSNGMALKPCNGDGDCSVPTPYCYSNYCVECLSNNNCFGRQCSPNLLECVQCLSNTDCGGGAPYCNQKGDCVQCVGDGNCPMGQRCSATTNRCVFACTTDANCTPIAPYCSPTLGTCVQCTTDANCGRDLPYCNTQVGACVGCLTDANCASSGGGSCRGFRCR
jgi:Cys-rich repeat protein